jgi:hypothetical protein
MNQELNATDARCAFLRTSDAVQPTGNVWAAMYDFTCRDRARCPVLFAHGGRPGRSLICHSAWPGHG